MTHTTRALAFIFACIFTAHNTRCDLPWNLVLGCMFEKKEKEKRQETLDLLAEHLKIFEPGKSKAERREKAFQQLNNLLFGRPMLSVADSALEPSQCSADTAHEKDYARVHNAVTLLQELNAIHPDVATLLFSVLGEAQESNPSGIANVDQFVIQAIETHKSLKSRL